jgi:hypothetical protein
MSGRQSQHDPRRGAGRRMRSGCGALAAAAAIALLGVAGCSATNGSTSTTAAQRAPLTCKQQYQAWRTGPANPGGRKLQADAAALGSADDDIPVMASDLKTIGADAAALEAYPMPQCADPAGYWTQYLAAVKAAGDNAGSASGLGALLLAAVPLKQVPAIQSKLNAELEKTVGVKAPLPAMQSPVAAPTLATVTPAAIPTLPTLATVAPATMPAPPPVPTLATLAPVPTTGS